jgi:hypothetical protein
MAKPAPAPNAVRLKSRYVIVADLQSLRPTQLTVGFEEVAIKRGHWQGLSKQEHRRFLAQHRFPCVHGPKKHPYIIDHHHLGVALIEEGIKMVKLTPLDDFSVLDMDEFWAVMDYHQWVHPYDAKGHRRDFNSVPKKLTSLTDDPYRSLAAKVCRAGGFPKDGEPFEEFLWADFFRHRVPVALLRGNPESAFRRAMKLAHRSDSSHLPGWSGVHQ